MNNERKSYVRCPNCLQEHFTDEVEFLDIEEDMIGRDVMTFVCPETFLDAKSVVYRGR